MLLRSSLFASTCTGCLAVLLVAWQTLTQPTPSLPAAALWASDALTKVLASTRPEEPRTEVL